MMTLSLVWALCQGRINAVAKVATALKVKSLFSYHIICYSAPHPQHR